MIDLPGIVAWLATAAGLVLFLRRMTRVPPPARTVLGALLGVTLAWQSSTLLEWVAIPETLIAYQEFAEMLLPFLWGGFLCAWLQFTVTQELAHGARSLEAERQFISTLMRATPVGIITCNRRGEITFANPHAESVLGISQSEMRRRSYNSAAWAITDEGGEPLPEAELPFRRVLDTGQPLFGYRHRVRTPADTAEGGTGRLLSINGMPVRTGDGHVTEVVFTVTDITEETRVQRRMARLNTLLRAVRNINQLIAREKDPEILLAGTCTHLVSAHGYRAARAFRAGAGEGLRLEVAAGAGLEGLDPFPPTEVLEQLWASGGVIWTGADGADGAARRTGAVRIEHAGRNYGILAVEAPANVLLSGDETALLDEVAGDIGLALHSLEQERALQLVLDTQTRRLDQLRALVLAGNDLARLTTTDELCRRAVELGRDRLGFERLGIWLRTYAPDGMEGAYGIDEHGQVRDERGVQRSWRDETRLHIQAGRRDPLVLVEGDLENHLGMPVGTGSRILASIWDGEHYLGHISADNLLSHRALSAHDAETLSLYAATFGHLYSRLKAEQAVREQEAIYRTIFENTGTSMVIMEADGSLSLVNNETVRLSGYTHDEIENRMRVHDFAFMDDPVTLEKYNIWRAGGEALGTRYTTEVRVHNREGERRSALVSIARIPDTERSVISLLDITSQKEAAAAHRRRAAQQTALNTIIAAGTQTTDIEHLMATALDQTLAALGLTRGILWLGNLHLSRGIPAQEIPPRHGEIWPGNNEDVPFVVENFDEGPTPVGASPDLRRMLPLLRALRVRALLAVPVLIDVGSETRKRIGKLALISDEPYPWSEEEIGLAAAVGQQLGSATERLRLLDQVRAQAERLQHVIDTVPEGVILIDQARHVVLANLIAGSLLRPVLHAAVGEPVERVGERAIDTLLDPPPRGSWHQVQAMGRTFEVIARPVISAAQPEGWVLVLRDVTEAREIDEHRQQQERLAAVGRLAAGIAHDFNNIMAVMLLYAQMGSRLPAMPPAARQNFDIIVQQTHRAANLIQQILDFSRRTAMERRPMDLLIFLKEICVLLEPALNETITMSFGHDPGEFRVNADPTRMQQVLMNLALNARDAMPHGGELTLWLDRLETGTEEPPVPDMRPGTWVRLRVSDTGGGMPAPVQSRLFEPFFTTKEPGLGTGLGLAQVHGILMQHEGAIRVDSELGQGTVVTLYLPALESSHDPRQDDVEARPESQLACGDGELALVVEDSAATRGAIVEALRSLNYSVIEARAGQDALAELQRRPGEIALVLTDAVMPGMGGLALFDAATALGFTIPFIIMSGHLGPEELPRTGIDSPLTFWLPQPVSMDKLAAVVADALSSRRETGEPAQET